MIKEIMKLIESLSENRFAVNIENMRARIVFS